MIRWSKPTAAIVFHESYRLSIVVGMPPSTEVKEYFAHSIEQYPLPRSM